MFAKAPPSRIWAISILSPGALTAIRRLGFGLVLVLGSMASVTAAPKVLPVLNHPIADRSGLAGTPLTVNLSSAFGTEAIDDQVVRFTSQFNAGSVPVVLDIALFSNRTPVTRQNFLNYVNAGRYTNSVIHRSVPGFVIQGGGYTFNGNFVNVPTDAPIVNEFGVSNTLGTISMAKVGGNPNSATSPMVCEFGSKFSQPRCAERRVYGFRTDHKIHLGQCPDIWEPLGFSRLRCQCNLWWGFHGVAAFSSKQ